MNKNPLLEPPPLGVKDKFRILVVLFIKKEIRENNKWTKDDYKREMIAAYKLIKQYPEFDFFYNLPDCTDKFNSLFGFQTKFWKSELQKRYNKWLTNREIILEDKNVVDLQVDKKSKSLLEFLN